MTALRQKLGALPLRVRLAATVIVVTVVMISWLVYIINHHEYDQAVADLQHELAGQARFKAEQLNLDIDKLRRDVLFLSRTPPVHGIRRAMGNGGVDPLENSQLRTWKKQLQQIFSSFITANPAYFQLRYIGVANHGLELVRVNRADGHPVIVPPKNLQNKGSRYYVEAALKLDQDEVYLSAIDLNREHGKVQYPSLRTLRAAAPVLGPDGERFGVVVINLDIGPLLDKLAYGVRDSIQVYLMNETGDYLLHPDRSKTFGFDRGEHYRWGDDMVPLNNQPEETGTFSRITTSGGVYYATTEKVYFDPRQSQRFITVAFTIPDTYISAQVASTRNVIIGGVMAALFVLGLIFFLFMKRVSLPLLQLTSAAVKISQRQYDTLLPKVSGGVIGTFVSAFGRMQTDIRERESRILQLNEELKRSETVANLIIDTAPEAIVVLNRDGKIVRANQRMSTLFGYSRQDLIGQSAEMLVPERYRMEHPLLCRDFVDNAESNVVDSDRELKLLHRNGSEFWVQIGLGIMELDRESYVIAALADVSKRKQAEEALKETAQRLARSNEELEQFAYVASHDLQEPLRSIAGPLQLLHKRYNGQLDDAADQLLEYSVNGATRMQQLIEDLLTFSRATRRVDSFANIDCNPLLAQVKQVLSAVINETGASVEWENLPCVYGDRRQIFQLFQNLIANAIKFHGKLPPRVKVSAIRGQDNRWRFAVRDNGIGIEPQHHERVFRIFQRLHTRREYGGTGIGLALCKRIVEHHGGKIWIDSSNEDGCVICFDLLEEQPNVDDTEENDIGTRNQAY